MNYREVVLDQIGHRGTSVIPYSLPMEDDVVIGLNHHYGSEEWRKKIRPFIVNAYAVDTDPKVVVDDIYAKDYFGGLWRMDKRPWHLEQPPLPAPEWGDYKFPEADEFYRPDWKENGFKICAEHKDSFVVGNLGWGLFERSWNLRGFENALMDAVVDPDFYCDMLDKVMNLYLDFVKYTVELPVDGILFGDDWGDQRGVMIGAHRWRELLKPRWAKIYEAVHAAGKIVMSHSCGSVEEIIPDLIEIGLDVLESVQPEAANMNSFDLKHKYGDKITFWGCLGSQSIIPYGTPSQIGEHVRRLCKEVGRDGGFVLAPAKPLQPETPIANAVAILEAFTNQN